jgi:hypothetical protein
MAQADAGKVTYTCNDVRTTIDPNDPACQADLAAYSSFEPSLLGNCSTGACAP